MLGVTGLRGGRASAGAVLTRQGARLGRRTGVLSVRGLANCSIRFYEAISLGRIPLFINTQCVLPYDKWVDWRSACLWVEDSDLPRLGRIVAGSHAALTPEAFAEKQKQCRALFEKWIRPEGFFRELWHHCSAD